MGLVLFFEEVLNKATNWGVGDIQFLQYVAHWARHFRFQFHFLDFGSLDCIFFRAQTVSHFVFVQCLAQ